MSLSEKTKVSNRDKVEPSSKVINRRRSLEAKSTSERISVEEGIYERRGESSRKEVERGSCRKPSTIEIRR
jgi:hypothetical protein